MQSHTWEIILRVLLALLLGGLVGLERELTDHPAGIRTHILVTVGACAFTTMSLYGFPGFLLGDRVAAGIVAGIGFIGGGAILKAKDGWVTGLTTAASLWSCAAIGMLVGTGYYLVGAVVTGMDLVVLEFIDWVVDKVSPRLKTRKLPVEVSGVHAPDNMNAIVRALSEGGCCPELIKYNRMEDGKRFGMALVAKVGSGTDMQSVTDSIYEIDGIDEVLWG